MTGHCSLKKGSNMVQAIDQSLMCTFAISWDDGRSGLTLLLSPYTTLFHALGVLDFFRVDVGLAANVKSLSLNCLNHNLTSSAAFSALS